MATATTLTTGQWGAYEIALTASSVDTVTFPVQVSTIEVINHSASGDISVRLDGTNPTALDPVGILVPAGTVRTINVRQADPTGDATQVKLISSGTPTYSVARVF
jgi:hypothetical protein